VEKSADGTPAAGGWQGSLKGAGKGFQAAFAVKQAACVAKLKPLSGFQAAFYLRRH
jgi:hypothetical protein